MPAKGSRTFSPRPSDVDAKWWVVDAGDMVLGRLAAQVAHILRGKHKPIFAPHLDTGDHVVIINAAKVRLTGNKINAKVWYRHSGYPGSLRKLAYDKLMQERPALVVEKAVQGMLPRNRIGRQMASKLKVYAGTEHPHQAQKPAVLDLRGGDPSFQTAAGGSKS